MAELTGAPFGFGNKPLFPGDKIIYTSRKRLFQGIIIKTNAQKSVVQETDENWNVKIFGYRYQTFIDNSRIFKLNE